MARTESRFTRNVDARRFVPSRGEHRTFVVAASWTDYMTYLEELRSILGSTVSTRTYPFAADAQKLRGFIGRVEFVHGWERYKTAAEIEDILDIMRMIEEISHDEQLP